jgi:hypothetical protein
MFEGAGYAAMSHPAPIGFRAHRPLAPQSHAIRAAALLDLLDREEVLLERVRLIGEGSDRQRREIEAELSEIRRDLERLGFPRKLNLAMPNGDPEKSTEELLEEYSRIATWTAQSARCARRVQEITAEVRRRAASGRPAARRRRRLRA